MAGELFVFSVYLCRSEVFATECQELCQTEEI